MRIIAGKYRRRKLQANSGDTTRPITDRAKEMLFQRMGDAGLIEGRKVADIFSGTGSLGLEALSRGASGAVFIEQDRRAHDLLVQNVEMVGAEDDTLCWRTDALKSSFRPKNVPHLVPFERIFYDPPYKMIEKIKPNAWIYKSLTKLAREDVSSADAILILRTPRDAEFDMPPVWTPRETIRLSTMELHLFDKSAASSEDEPTIDS